MPDKKFLDDLKNVPLAQSQYEFTNFFLEKYPTPARRLVAVIEQIIKLQTALESNILPADVDVVNNQLQMLLDYYDSIPNKENILANYEVEEQEYWTIVLGKKAAIEIISAGRTSIETMTKMSQLPNDDFEECVRICVMVANLIKDSTETVENALAEPTSNVIKT